MKARDVLAALLRRRALHGLSRTLHRASLSGLGVLNHTNDQVSGEEHLVCRVLPMLLDVEEPLVLDVGANRGDYTALVLRAFPRAEVHAFEPHPETFGRLSLRFGDQVHCHELAMGQRSGELEIFDYADSDGSSHATAYRAVIEEIRGRASVRHAVRVSTVDDQAAALELRRIHLLKIDTEGHELSVLQGAQQQISGPGIDVVQFEFNEMHVISRTFMRDFLEQLPGYTFFRLLPDGLAPLGAYKAATWEIFAFQNIVALSPKVTSRL